MADKQYFVYMLECSNGNYYTGYTTDITRRYQEHLAGTKKCKYTRSFPPRRLAAGWSISIDTESAALQVECFIKKLARSKKNILVRTPLLLKSLLPGHLAAIPIKTLTYEQCKEIETRKTVS